MDINDIPLAARFESRGQQYARIVRTDRERAADGWKAESFGLYDAKGREFGHSYFIDREFWVIDAAGNTIVPIERLEDRLEETFIVYPQGLRDGAKFGALPTASYKRFRTLDEARAYGAKCIDRAYKSAIKKASA